MTIRRKLVLSNISMIIIPLLLSLIFGCILLETHGSRYWSSLEEMYMDQNGVYSAQSLIYAYRDEVLKGEWEKYEEIETGEESFSVADVMDLKDLDQELEDMGYHIRVRINGEIVYSNLTEQEEYKIKEYSGESGAEVGGLILSDEESSLIKNTFQADQEKVEIAAVGMIQHTVSDEDDSYLRKYVFSFLMLFALFVLLAVVLTNIFLSRFITHMILKPLRILRGGAKEIADGNLEFQIDYHRPDEFGEVCKEFDEMRWHLKDSVETQLKYEQYRRELIVGISHDLRTPLTSIKGYVEGLKDGIANTEEKKQRYYDAIHTRALDIEALVDSFSMLAELENNQYQYKLEPVNIDVYLRQVMQEYQEEAKQKKLVFLYDNQSVQTRVKIDIQEMNRVFRNLFENSVKYRKKDESVIRIQIESHDKILQIRVADDGPGVPDDELMHIFNSFYRGDKSRTNAASGSGLGLAIAKRIVEGNHGAIRAYNENGLVMLITLPVVRDDTERDTIK